MYDTWYFMLQPETGFYPNIFLHNFITTNIRFKPINKVFVS